MNRGFAWLPIIVIVGLIAIAGGWYVTHNSSAPTPVTNQTGATTTAQANSQTQSCKQLEIGYSDFYKDSTAVYIGNCHTVIDQADPKTFEIVPLQKDDSTDLTPYVKDANHVWYEPLSSPSVVQLIVGADSASFQELGHNVGTSFDANAGDFYARDKNSVYFDGEKLPGADPVTFVFVGTQGTYDAKDVNHEYWDGKIVQ